MSYYLCSFETFEIVKINLQWPIIYGKYGLGWQWPMLHNTLTVAEWEGGNVYCSMATKQCSIKWLENYFSDEQKQKDAEAAAHFQLKAAKIAQVIIILRMFVLENLISVISVLIDIHIIFISSINGFWAIDYHSPPPRANTLFSYIVQNTVLYVNTYTGKSFWWHKWGG